MTALYITLGGCALLGMLCWVCYHAGKSDERASATHAILDATTRAADIRDRLRRDAAYAGRLRARFTR